MNLFISRKKPSLKIVLLLGLFGVQSAQALGVTLDLRSSKILAVDGRLRALKNNDPIFHHALGALLAYSICSQTQCGLQPCRSARNFSFSPEELQTHTAPQRYSHLYFDTITCSKKTPRELLKETPLNDFEILPENPLMPRLNPSRSPQNENLDTQPLALSSKRRLSGYLQLLLFKAPRTQEAIDESQRIFARYKLRWSDFVAEHNQRLSQQLLPPAAQHAEEEFLAWMHQQPEALDFLLPPYSEIRKELRHLRKTPEKNPNAIQFLSKLAHYYERRIRRLQSLEGHPAPQNWTPTAYAEIAQKYYLVNTEAKKTLTQAKLQQAEKKIAVQIYTAIMKKIEVLAQSDHQSSLRFAEELRSLTPVAVNQALYEHMRTPKKR